MPLASSLNQHATLEVVLNALDLIGVFVFSVSGATLAIKKNLDIIAAYTLATVAGIAGGILRDLLLGHTPPDALKSSPYLLLPLVATLVVIGFPKIMAKLSRPVLIFDAAGLALFTVSGTTKALHAGLAFGPCILLGVITAAGGGMLRDVMVSDVPHIFKPESNLYVVPSLIGAGVLVISSRFGSTGSLPMLGAAIITFVIRIGSIRFGWSTPHLGHRVSHRENGWAEQD